MTSPGPFRILAICTGNICRSPAMEGLLAARLAADGRFSAESAGTEAMVGWDADPAMVRLLDARGIDIEGHRARQADPAMLGRADLILTATFAHREWVTHAAPGVARRTFTLSEFASVVGDAPREGDPAGLVSWAAAHRPPARAARARSTRRGGAPGDIVDPYGRGRAVFEQCLAQIDPLVEAVGKGLLGRA